MMLKNFPEKIPDPVAEELIKEFHGRCGRCNHKLPIGDMRGKGFSSLIHEIIPRGAIGKKAMAKENRIPLCGECHSWAHTVGTSCSIPVLMSYRSRHD